MITREDLNSMMIGQLVLEMDIIEAERDLCIYLNKGEDEVAYDHHDTCHDYDDMSIYDSVDDYFTHETITNRNQGIA